MTRAERLLRELRAEVKKSPAQPSNIGAIERVIEKAIAEVRELNASDRVFISSEMLERLEEFLRSTGEFLPEAERKTLQEIVAEARGKEPVT